MNGPAIGIFPSFSRFILVLQEDWKEQCGRRRRQARPENSSTTIEGRCFPWCLKILHDAHSSPKPFLVQVHGGLVTHRSMYGMSRIAYMPSNARVGCNPIAFTPAAELGRRTFRPASTTYDCSPATGEDGLLLALRLLGDEVLAVVKLAIVTLPLLLPPDGGSFCRTLFAISRSLRDAACFLASSCCRL